MVNTVRSLSTLLTAIFQDGQGDNSMNAQDLRDLIVSLVSPHGGSTMEANAVATTIVAAGTYETVAGVFVAIPDAHDITVSASGVITFTGASPRHFHIVSNFDMLAGGNNKVVSAQWFKNGTTALSVPVKRKVSTGTDVGAVSVHADTVLSNGDTIQLKIANDTDTVSVTLQDAYVFAMGFLM